MEKKRIFLDYENELRVLLLLFVFVLMIINFGTSKLFNRAAEIVILREEERLRLIGEMIAEKISGELDTKYRKERVEDTGSFLAQTVSRYDLVLLKIINRDSIIVFSSESDNIGKKLSLREFLPEDLEKVWSGRSFFSRPYGKEKGAKWSYLTPVRDKEWKVTAFVQVESSYEFISNLIRASKVEFVARISGLSIALVLVFFMVGAILRPILKPKVKAEFEREGKDVEFVVREFEDAVMAMKEKEKGLETRMVSAEKQARELANYNEYILSSIPIGVVNFNEEGYVTYINRAASKMLDIKESDFIGRNFTSLFHDKNFLGRKNLSIVEDDRNEIEIDNRSGRKIRLSVSSSLLRDKEGKTIGTTILLSDITEIKKLQEEMILKEKLAVLGEMSAGIAHEFRNSLGAIVGFAGLLKRKISKDDERQQILNNLFEEVRSLEDVMEQFLRFASDEKFNFKPLQVNEIIIECADLLKEKLKKKKVKILLELTPRTPEIKGDRTLLGRAFLNLIQNSMDAMSQGGELKIRSGEKITNGSNEVEIVFSDTGCGISSEIQQKIYNPFFTTKERGVGLGLAIVQKIVHGHSGRIEIESKTGEGTIVKVYLPIYEK